MQSNVYLIRYICVAQLKDNAAEFQKGIDTKNMSDAQMQAYQNRKSTLASTLLNDDSHPALFLCASP